MLTFEKKKLKRTFKIFSEQPTHTGKRSFCTMNIKADDFKDLIDDQSSFFVQWTSTAPNNVPFIW